MNLLFIADHHIKLGQKNVPKDWARNRYSKLWNEIAHICSTNNIDAIVHGGDIFDRLPSMEELEVFFEMLNILKNTKQIMYSGNHEASGKYSTWLKHFSEAVKAYNCTLIEEWTPNYWPGVDILPYTDLKKNIWHNSKGRILFTHVRGNIPPHVKAEVDLNLFNSWELVIAGDLHAYSNSQRNIMYPGSPVTTTFHRTVSKDENGVILLNINNGKTNITHISLNLPQLIRKTITDVKEMIPSDYHHVIYELVGDIQELKSQEQKINKDLLDKKITKRTSEATLNLRNKSIDEELYEYLVQVEKVKNPQDIIQEFHDYIKTA